MIDHTIDEGNELTISMLIFCGLRCLAELLIKDKGEFSLAPGRKYKPMLCVQIDFEKKRFRIILVTFTTLAFVPFSITILDE